MYHLHASFHRQPCRKPYMHRDRHGWCNQVDGGDEGGGEVGGGDEGRVSGDGYFCFDNIARTGCRIVPSISSRPSRSAPRYRETVLYIYSSGILRINRAHHLTVCYPLSCSLWCTTYLNIPIISVPASIGCPSENPLPSHTQV